MTYSDPARRLELEEARQSLISVLSGLVRSSERQETDVLILISRLCETPPKELQSRITAARRAGLVNPDRKASTAALARVLERTSQAIAERL